jgi:hypothetical protein
LQEEIKSVVMIQRPTTLDYCMCACPCVGRGGGFQ